MKTILDNINTQLQTNFSESVIIIGMLVLIIVIVIIYMKYDNIKTLVKNNLNIEKNNSSIKNKKENKCSSKTCLDNYEYNKCDCCNNNNHINNELFTMAQSVFPLNAPTIPANQQILNENITSLKELNREKIDINEKKYTRNQSLAETTTGLFNYIPINKKM